MKEHGIMFSRPMVKALLDGRKTQTRRLATSPLRRVVAGDLLWVRETFWLRKCYTYAADYDAAGEKRLRETGWVKKPAIHMPRKASRIELRVICVAIEPLQNISEADALAEGMREPYLGDGDPPFEEQASMISSRKQFRNIWWQLHGKESWDANPNVVAIEFERVK